MDHLCVVCVFAYAHTCARVGEGGQDAFPVQTISTATLTVCFAIVIYHLPTTCNPSLLAHIFIFLLLLLLELI